MADLEGKRLKPGKNAEGAWASQSSHLFLGPCAPTDWHGTHQDGDGSVERAHGLQRFPLIFIPVFPLHTHGDEGSRIGVQVILFI